MPSTPPTLPRAARLDGAFDRPLPPRDEMVRAVVARDPSYDGVFLYGVRTTGIFCRPSCRPPRPPRPDHLELFPSPAACLLAGYRPCTLCRPSLAPGAAPSFVADLVARVDGDPARPVTAAELRGMGLGAERVRRAFLEAYGVTFAAWSRARRLAEAFTALRGGVGVAAAGVDAGFESESGFRAAFARAFGRAPVEEPGAPPLLVRRIETSIGPFVAGATERGVALLELADRRMLERNVRAVLRRLRAPALPGPSPILDRLEAQVLEHLAGTRRAFDVPLDPQGTAFERTVWDALREIPYGETRSYGDVARAIGRPSATRAVARANGANRIAILIPCHRVVGADGALGGYGGGVWRKRILLALEGAPAPR